jgi:hypothetical protein
MVTARAYDAVVSKAVKPKKECCVSKPRCRRCPLLMLAEGTLPDGYTVKKRKLVKVGGRKKRKKRKKDKHKAAGTKPGLAPAA